jgi:soluble lytic murein transglycosylase-like protein
MATTIPCVSQYYLEDGVFILKSKWNKWLRQVTLVAATALALSPITANNITNLADSIELKFATKEAALVEYIQSQNKKLSTSVAYDIVKSTVKWAEEFGHTPELLVAIMKQESNFETYAISSAGAIGIMQVMGAVHLDKMIKAKQVVGTPEPFNVDANIYMGSMIYKKCLDNHKVDSLALKCYNGSMKINNGYEAKVLNHHKAIVNFVRENV